jgi:hypothetical protein
MAEKFHGDWEVVPYDLNKKPKEDPDAYALVLANTERQLEAMPPRQRSSTQSYFARPVLTAPTQPLLLEGSTQACSQCFRDTSQAPQNHCRCG